MEDRSFEHRAGIGTSPGAGVQRPIGGAVLRVTPDVTCLQLSIVNAYFVGERMAEDRSWVLVDAGMPFSTGRIREAAEERFGPHSRPSAIVLTHGHFDHVGALPDLADEWDVPIYAHELEMPYLTGRSGYPPPDPAVGGGALSFLSRLYPRGPFDLGPRLQVLPADGHVPGMSGWRWIHTPGHAPGHISLFRESDRLLIVGDAFVTTKQESAFEALVLQHAQVRRPPAYFTVDWDAARRSVEALSQLEPEIAATGHGLPMHGERMRQQLRALVKNWEWAAVPAQGRYVYEPAVTNEDGVVSVPPPVPDPQFRAVAGIGLATVIGGLLLRGLTRRSG